MRSIGAGVRELRVRDQTGAIRVIYFATRHAFQKKTQATARPDLEVAAARLRMLMRSKP